MPGGPRVHTCFVVKDLDAAVTKLQERGVELTSPELSGEEAVPWQA